MAVSSRKSSGPVLRSLSPSGRFAGACGSSVSSTGFASSSSSFISSGSTTFFQSHNRSASPTRVNLRGVSSYAPSVRFSLLDRPISPNRSISVAPKKSPHHHHDHHQRPGGPQTKRTCLCSPTNHPGSFRCSLHKNAAVSPSAAVNYSPNRLNARRSAMTNSLVRIGGVEGGDLVKRALAALIRPSSHQQRRRGSFQPRPSRLSVMSTAEDDSSSNSIS